MKKGVRFGSDFWDHETNPGMEKRKRVLFGVRGIRFRAIW